MNGFRKMQERLREEGWYVGWNEPCCQSCAWGCLPDYHDAVYDSNGYLVHPVTGEELDWQNRDDVYTELDLSKVLFNHSQDCEVYLEEEDCPVCHGEEGHQDDDGTWHDCHKCQGEGFISEPYDGDPEDLDNSVPGFKCYTPEAQHYSTFCFDGSKQGVKNLKAIIPIIEECGCTITWNGKADSRPDIAWQPT